MGAADPGREAQARLGGGSSYCVNDPGGRLNGRFGTSMSAGARREKTAEVRAPVGHQPASAEVMLTHKGADFSKAVVFQFRTIEAVPSGTSPRQRQSSTAISNSRTGRDGLTHTSEPPRYPGRFRCDLQGVRAEHGTRNTPNNTRFRMSAFPNPDLPTRCSGPEVPPAGQLARSQRRPISACTFTARLLLACGSSANPEAPRRLWFAIHHRSCGSAARHRATAGL